MPVIALFATSPVCGQNRPGRKTLPRCRYERQASGNERPAVCSARTGSSAIPVLQQRHALPRKITRRAARCCRCEWTRTTVPPVQGRMPSRKVHEVGDDMRIVGLIQVRAGRWLRPLRSAAMAILLLVVPVCVSPVKAATSTAAETHVYLLRGVLNIFSLGLDDIARQVAGAGYSTVTVANFVSWSSLADEAAAEYRSGRTKTIVLVGHSSGATALPDMVARLDQLGAPVKLAIGLDSVFRTKPVGTRGTLHQLLHCQRQRRAGREDRAIPGQAREYRRGQNVPGVGHMSIDKNEIMQRKVIGEIDAVVFGRLPRGAEAADLERARQDPPGARQRHRDRAQLSATPRAANSAHSSATRHPVRPGDASPLAPVRTCLTSKTRERKAHESVRRSFQPPRQGSCCLPASSWPLRRRQSGGRRSDRRSDPCGRNGRCPTRRPAAEAAAPPRGRVYLFRGALGPIFSRGMDRLTDRLEEAGIRADVYEFTICRLIADQAIRRLPRWIRRRSS